MVATKKQGKARKSTHQKKQRTTKAGTENAVVEIDPKVNIKSSFLLKKIILRKNTKWRKWDPFIFHGEKRKLKIRKENS